MNKILDSKRFFTSLLLAIVLGMGTTTYKVFETSFIVAEIKPIVSSNHHELFAVKTQLAFTINEQAEIKPIIYKTRNEQISRGDEIECIQKIRDVFGCGLTNFKGVNFETF